VSLALSETILKILKLLLATMYGLLLVVKSIAANVFICDYTHGYKQAANIPYQNQPFEPYGAIRVGRGTWIGQNCVILYGVNIGEQCIIGANSVVTKSIPDRCIVMGSPAKVTKIWDYERNIWVKP